MNLYAWLVGAWAAILWFFTFGVARVLFAVFPRERAGEITTALFPAYFLVAVLLGVMATATLWFRRKKTRDLWAFALQVLALAALIVIPLFIQPAIVQHAPGTPEWARWHGISMALNVFSLIAVPAASLLVFARRKE
jgi:cytochrome bd-type quinol oxidase subunit 2